MPHNHEWVDMRGLITHSFGLMVAILYIYDTVAPFPIED
jgi:hypothetical protein